MIAVYYISMNKMVDIKTEVIFPGRKKNQCWFSPTFTVVPSAGPNTAPFVLLSALQLTANDLGPLHYSYSSDLGKTWAPPFETQNIFGIPLDDNIFEIPYLYPFYHRASNTLAALGATMFHRDAGQPFEYNKYKMEWHVFGRKSSIGFALWDNAKKDFFRWNKIDMGPIDSRIHLFSQRWHEEDDGAILFPYYTDETESTDTEFSGISKVGTIKMSFDGTEFKLLSIGTEICIEKKYGLSEPDIVKYGRKYYMTIRSEIFEGENLEGHDNKMYHAQSDDGLNWYGLEDWKWDDGSPVQTENTQQCWLRHKDNLYLIYTRINDRSHGVFRNRAPLWIAQVDTSNLSLIKNTERVIFSGEGGVRCCNFSVHNVTETEAWVMVGEWILCQDPTIKESMRFWSPTTSNSVHYNKCQYLGDLKLARIRFDSR